MNEIKAIETVYAGCRFRSRLEARWAVLFNALEIEWHYELQGYDIDGQWYLPDFYLPACRTHVEVKGSEEALDKPLMRKVPFHLPASISPVSFPSLLLLGPIPDPANYGWNPGWVGLSVGSPFDDEPPILTSSFWGFYWAHYPIFREDASGATPVDCGDYADWLSPALTLPKENPMSMGLVRNAYVKARSARFEHGERG